MKKLWLIAALVAGVMSFAQQTAPSGQSGVAAPAVAADDGGQPQTVVPVVVVEREVVVPVAVAPSGCPENAPRACSGEKKCGGGSTGRMISEPPWYDVVLQLMLMDIPVGTIMIKGWQLTSGALVVILLVVMMSLSSARRKAALAAAAAKAAETKSEPAEPGEEDRK
ncbi:MAG: hypothetical protein AB7F40_05790 [Victivallaceae bacterium]|nr:hypothetical protein [Victivallaceae bacterium]